MSLPDHGFRRREIRQGGGRGSGSDHVDELFGSTELYIYQTPNVRPKGYQALKLYLESQECEFIYTTESPVDVGGRYDIMRITFKGGNPIPDQIIKRSHSWAHSRNFLHSFFKPMYR